MDFRILIGNANPRGNAMGTGGKADSRETSTVETTRQGDVLHATPSNDHTARKRIRSSEEVNSTQGLKDLCLNIIL